MRSRGRVSGKANALARIRFPPRNRRTQLRWRDPGPEPHGNVAGGDVRPLPLHQPQGEPRRQPRVTGLRDRDSAAQRLASDESPFDRDWPKVVAALCGRYHRRLRIRQRRSRIGRAFESPAGNSPEPAIQRTSRSNGLEAWRPPAGRCRFRPSPSPPNPSRIRSP